MSYYLSAELIDGNPVWALCLDTTQGEEVVRVYPLQDGERDRAIAELRRYLVHSDWP